MMFQCGNMSLVDVKFFGQSLETIYNEIKEICKETDLLPINSVWGQVCSEWNNFELTANSEIQYLQEVRI